METPVFSFIPIIGDGRAALRMVSLRGVSTKHGSTDTDRGLMYATINKVGATHTLSLYSDAARTAKVAEGTTDNLEEFFDLAQQNASGISGQAIIKDYTAPSKLVLVVSFAVDSDIQSNVDEMQNYPGYDPDEYGLAAIIADAMKSIMTSGLPAAAPKLYSGAPISPFMPASDAAELPDLLKIANPEALRQATASLAKAMSWQQQEHQDEAKDLADRARARYDSIMALIRDANAPIEQETPVQGSGSIEFGEFARG
jgi:hypothetical protein